MKKIGDKQIVRQLMPYRSVKRKTIKISLALAALALLIVSLARPQAGSKISNEKREGIETIICMDISNSMLAEDVVPSRLEKAKLLIENMMDKFVNDKVGLIVFAGDAFVQLPITADHVSAKMFLQDLSPALIQTQGTDIAAAINLATKSFTQKDGSGKAIIIITDGEDHEGGAEDAAAQASKQGFQVYMLGIGSANGAPIPTGDGSYMTDNTGETVMTRLNEDMCKKIVSAGKGVYIHVDNNTDAQNRLNSHLEKLEKGETASIIYSEYEEQFQWIGLLIILILIIDTVVMERKNLMLSRFNFFNLNIGKKNQGKTKDKAATSPQAKNGKMASFIILISLLLSSTAAFGQTDRQHVSQGNKAYRQNQYDKSELAYRKAIDKNQNNPQAQYNLGCSLLKQQKDSLAMQQFSKAAQLETNKTRKAMSFHNMGWICQKQKQYDQAIEHYKQALRLNPHDNATRYNLALCKRQQKKQNNQDKNQNKEKQQDKQDKQDKQEEQKQKEEQKENEQDKQQQQPKNNEMSKQNAEQMLNAAQQQEKATQQKLKDALQQPSRRSLQKNW